MDSFSEEKVRRKSEPRMWAKMMHISVVLKLICQPKLFSVECFFPFFQFYLDRRKLHLPVRDCFQGCSVQYEGKPTFLSAHSYMLSDVNQTIQVVKRIGYNKEKTWLFCKLTEPDSSFQWSKNFKAKLLNMSWQNITFQDVTFDFEKFRWEFLPPRWR